jgi:hypothetical protein
MRFVLILLLVANVSFGQPQEHKVLFYNIGFGGLTSGIGAVINKPKGSKWTHYFIKGLWQGSIGGALHYSAKKTIYLVNKNENLVYAWPAKLLHHAGSSIIENAALNEPFLQNWNIDFGPARFDFALKGEKKFRVRFLPWSIPSYLMGISNGRFDVRTTLLTGNLAYRSKYYLPKGSNGISYGRAIGYIADEDKHFYIAHELVHQFQFDEYQVFNSWLKPLEPKVSNWKVKALFDKYIYLDIPYFLAFYGLEGIRYDSSYYRNFYEFEAERFATNKYVPIY